MHIYTLKCKGSERNQVFAVFMRELAIYRPFQRLMEINVNVGDADIEEWKERNSMNIKWTYQWIILMSLPTEIMVEENTLILNALIRKGFIVSI